MALLYADRVKDTSSTTGTGDFTLAGSPPTGYQSFNAAFSTTNSFAYCIEGGAEWEVGIGHLSAATTLVRDTVTGSSNAGAAVDFSAGTKNVFCTIPATYATGTKTIRKPANESRASDTTLTVDDDLQFAMFPNTSYLIELYVAYAANSGTPGIKFRYNTPTNAPQLTRATTRYHTTMGSQPFTVTYTHRYGTTTTGETLTSTGSSFGTVRMELFVTSHATLTSTFGFEWAQNTSAGAGNETVVQGGSWLRYTRLT